MHFILIKHAMVSATGDGQHAFMGGKHAFACMARTLAAAGHQVHLLTDADKRTVMHGAMMGGHLGQLRYSQAVEGVVSWQQQGLQNLTWHVSLRDQDTSHAAALSSSLSGLGMAAADGAPAVRLAPAMQRIGEEAASIASGAGASSVRGGGNGSEQVWVVMDADETQHTPGITSTTHQQQQQQQQQQQGTLMEALQRQFGRRLLMFVQNVHHLPFGPCSTAPQTPGLLAAWAGVGGVLAVSQFVVDYIAAASAAVPPALVVPLATWGVFGQPPFAALGERVFNLMQQQAQSPVVGMLKLTPEKGASVFLGLAHALPHLQFLAVAADSHAQQQLGALPPNVRLIAPQSDIKQVLQHMWVVLAPSLQQEAFGMVVVDAMLRGIPAIVSSSGGLPEAGLGVAQVVPLQAGNIASTSTAAAGNQPQLYSHQTAAAGDVCQQDMQPWMAALQAVLGCGPEAYLQASRAARAAAQQYVASGPQQLQQLLAWLKEKAADLGQ